MQVRTLHDEPERKEKYMNFRLWGPQATKVELTLDGTQIPMTAGADGWWTAEVVSAGPGTDYAFILNDSHPLPDPRSSWQPQGVHGPSRVLDHGAFAWTDERWQPGPLASAMLYE